MDCPHCKKEPLIVLEYEDVEVDYCTVCEGIWLDAGEIELLFGDAGAAARVLSIGTPAFVPRGEKRRRCPICDKKMTKESTLSDPPVTFDHCPKGDGLWFDKGELAEVLSLGGALKWGKELTDFLGGMFPGKGAVGLPGE